MSFQGLMVSSDLSQAYTVRDPLYLRNEQYKRCSRASDTSSAYSGSDMMQSSLDEQENGDSDLPSNLMESLVDSDDEEGYGESTEVIVLKQTEIVDPSKPLNLWPPKSFKIIGQRLVRIG